MGRTSLNDVEHPESGEIMIAGGEEIDFDTAMAIEAAGIDEVEVRSVLTCETKSGVCVKCYGKNLATARTVQVGEAVGVIAAQSIGEPGTQLTLRTFHVGGTASKISDDNDVKVKFDGVVEIDDLREVSRVYAEGEKETVVVSRSSEFKVVEPKTGVALSTTILPYGSFLKMFPGEKSRKEILFVHGTLTTMSSSMRAKESSSLK